jgi:hypothetical protein
MARVAQHGAPGITEAERADLLAVEGLAVPAQPDPKPP